jgi:phosphate uptake regulator
MNQLDLLIFKKAEEYLANAERIALHKAAESEDQEIRYLRLALRELIEAFKPNPLTWEASMEKRYEDRR